MSLEQHLTEVLHPWDHFTAADGFRSMAVRWPNELAEAAIDVLRRLATDGLLVLDFRGEANGDVLRAKRTGSHEPCCADAHYGPCGCSSGWKPLFVLEHTEETPQ